MKAAKTSALVAGSLAIIVGLVWIGQGSGYFPYPAESFMIGQGAWIEYGVVILLVGIAMLFAARRLDRR